MLRACKPLESNSFCAISQSRERPCRSATAYGLHVSLEKIRKPVACRWVERSETHPTCALPRDGGEVGPTPGAHSRGSFRG
jgi:hypothetical protein